MHHVGDPLQQIQLHLKQWDEDSVELQVTHCGVCGSDIHTLEQTWGPNDWPVVLGHEIAGKVTRIGKNVATLQIGDRAIVGPQSGSCHECEACNESLEHMCSGQRCNTYNDRWANGDKTYGGFADKWRGDYRFVVKVPECIPNEMAATFSCAGVTTYIPLKRTNVNSDSVVGVVGLGGLGHYGILWAKAMGAKVIGLSHNDQKRIVAGKLGCDDYVNTSDETQLSKYTKKLTHILCTGTGPDFEWSMYFKLLRMYGHFINVMLPEWRLPPLDCWQFNPAHVFIHGSLIGSPNDIKETLEFAAENHVRPWIQLYSMKDINKALGDFKEGKPRFKIILENQL